MTVDPEAFVHPRAIVEDGAAVGPRTRVWAFAHVLAGAVLGADCNVCDHVFVEGRARVGDRVTIKSGVQLWDGVTLEDDVFVGPNATFTNDPFPRSRRHIGSYPETIVRRGASIGANATILPGLTIGREAMIGAGAVVTRDVPPMAIVRGNPASIGGYVDAARARVDRPTHPEGSSPRTTVDRVRLIELPEVVDLRGRLSFAELGGLLPFPPRRYFLVYGVSSREVRGEHAHRELEQFLVCVHGDCKVIVDDGRVREEIALARPDLGLYIGPEVWSVQYAYSSDAVLMVLASAEYAADDYVRDYDEFLALRGSRGRS